MNINFSIYCLVFVSFLTWLVFLVTLAKLARFFNEFKKFRLTNDAELNSQVWHIKRLESEISEIIVELRRSNKLLYEIRGTGEFSDEICDFRADPEAVRQEKITKQKIKPARSYLDSVGKLRSPFASSEKPQCPPVPSLENNVDVHHAATPPPEADKSIEHENNAEEELSTDTSIINYNKSLDS